MAIATPDYLLMPIHAYDAYRFDVLDRSTLAPVGTCALTDISAHEERPRRCIASIDTPEAAKPAIRHALLRWYDQLDLAAIITLDDGTVVDIRVPSPEAEALYHLARTQLPPLTEALNVPDHFLAKTPGDFAYVLNLHRCFDGLLVEAGFAFPMNLAEEWAFFAQRSVSGTDIRLRVVRHVTMEEALHAVLAEAEALRMAWFDKTRDEVKKEIANRQKVFAARITAQLKPLGFRKKTLHWTYTRPDGYHVDFNAQKSAYTDGFYFNLLLTEPDKHPWYMGLIDERPLGVIMDWQAIPGEDFDDLLRAVVQRRILPLMNEPIDRLTGSMNCRL